MSNRKTMRIIEVLFDLLYLGTIAVLGGYYLFTAQSMVSLLFGAMALVLLLGDACHLIPRIFWALSGSEEAYRSLLGTGKMIASVTMTLFYVLLWHIGLLAFSLKDVGVWTTMVYVLGAVRIALALVPQNGWSGHASPVAWGLYRNVPFCLLGGMVGFLFFFYRASAAGLSWMWLAILLSFAFYLPVVFGAKKYPMLGMLMLPKSCAYVWVLCMGL